MSDPITLRAQPSIDEFTASQTQLRSPFTSQLAGIAVELMRDGHRLELTFLDDHLLRRRLDGDDAELRYDATAIRPGIFLVDATDPGWPFEGGWPDRYPPLVTWALDLDRGRATAAVSGAVIAHHSGQGLLVKARTDHEFWSVDPNAERHPRTHALVGRRIRWRYSDTDEYEHTYLNGEAFAWQAIRGAERGISELDPSRAYEIDDGLVFFHWAETALVVESAALVDLRSLRTFGRFYALDADDGGARHHQYGAVGQLLSEIDYEDPERRPV